MQAGSAQDHPGAVDGRIQDVLDMELSSWPLVLLKILLVFGFGVAPNDT